MANEIDHVSLVKLVALTIELSAVEAANDQMNGCMVQIFPPISPDHRSVQK